MVLREYEKEGYIMIDPVTMNARKPRDDSYGHAMLNRMNDRHRELYKWGLEHVSLDTAEKILDIGYGGGQNIKNMRKIAPNARFWGIDYSPASYKKCSEVNHDGIQEGTVNVEIGSVEHLPYEKDFFSLVTAFETVYYWPNIDQCLRNVYEVLEEKGAFLICNEDCTLEGHEDIADALDMRFFDTEELEAMLRNAGFRTVHTYRHGNGSWVCAVGRK